MTDSVLSSLIALGKETDMAIAHTAIDIGREVKEQIQDIQGDNGFWTNRTFQALESIDNEAEEREGGNVIAIKVGFLDGLPAEQRKDGLREYGQYIANYSRGGNELNSFLGRAMSLLSAEFARSMPDVANRLQRSQFNATTKTWTVR